MVQVCNSGPGNLYHFFQLSHGLVVSSPLSSISRDGDHCLSGSINSSRKFAQACPSHQVPFALTLSPRRIPCHGLISRLHVSAA